jgi:alkaline phosphatase D
VTTPHPLPREPAARLHRLRGYTGCAVIRDRWYADLRVVDTIERPGAPVRTLASYVVAGRPGAEQV